MDNNQKVAPEATASRGLQRLNTFLDALTWRKIILIALGGAVVVGLVVFLFVPRRYEGKASLLLREQPDVATSLSLALSLAAGSGSGSGSAGAGSAALGALGLISGSSELQRLEAALSSRRVADELLAKYHLRKRFGLNEQGALHWLDKMTTVKELGAGLIAGVGGSGVGLEITVSVPGSSRMLQWIGRPSPFSTAEAKQYCAQMANDYVTLLDRYFNETNVQSARQDRLFIEHREREAKANLRQTEDRLQALQTKYQVMDPGPTAQHLLDVSRDAVQAYAGASATLDADIDSLRTARGSLTHEQAMRVTEEMKQRNPVLAGLEDKLAQMRMDYATGLASGKSPQHPDMVALHTAITSAEQQEAGVAQQVRDHLTMAPNPVYDAIVGQVVTLEIGVAAARASKAKYGAMLAKLNARLDSLPPVARAYAHLAAQRDLQASLVAAMATRLEIAIIQEHMQSAEDFQLLDVAVPPDEKSGPSTALSAGGAFALIVLVLGLMMAYRRGVFSLED